MQRRKSGIYEFRRRLPEALAGKAVPKHMAEDFGELINPRTSRFKDEIVRSLNTKDLREAKRRDHQATLDANELFEKALLALRLPDTANSSASVTQKIGACGYNKLILSVSVASSSLAFDELMLCETRHFCRYDPKLTLSSRLCKSNSLT